jgi:hypothetical protein
MSDEQAARTLAFMELRTSEALETAATMAIHIEVSEETFVERARLAHRAISEAVSRRVADILELAGPPGKDRTE